VFGRSSFRSHWLWFKHLDLLDDLLVIRHVGLNQAGVQRLLRVDDVSLGLLSVEHSTHIELIGDLLNSKRLLPEVLPLHLTVWVHHFDALAGQVVLHRLEGPVHEVALGLLGHAVEP